MYVMIHFGFEKTKTACPSFVLMNCFKAFYAATLFIYIKKIYGKIDGLRSRKIC